MILGENEGRIMTPKEDLRDWIVDNWFTVEDEIEQTMKSTLANKIDSVDLEFASYDVSDAVKQGILNVIDTYEEVE
jgi:hypothetical protein